MFIFLLYFPHSLLVLCFLSHDGIFIYLIFLATRFEIKIKYFIVFLWRLLWLLLWMCYYLCYYILIYSMMTKYFILWLPIKKYWDILLLIYYLYFLLIFYFLLLFHFLHLLIIHVFLLIVELFLFIHWFLLCVNNWSR